MRRLSQAVLLSFLLAGCSGKPATPTSTSAPAAAPLVVTQTVSTTTKQGGDRFSATVEPDTRVNLTFNSGGYVTNIRQLPGKGGVHILGAGDRVRRGEVLAELRSLEYRAKVNEAESSLGQSLAGESDAQASVDLARAQTRQSRGIEATTPLRNGQVTIPSNPPIRKVMAASWKGGTCPLAAVSNASTAHMRTAVKPMSVAVLRDKNEPREEIAWYSPSPACGRRWPKAG